MPKSRLEAFSDCIIAFAVTLLIYDSHLQDLDADLDNSGMIHALLALAPHFSIYVISFLICTVWWMGHHVKSRWCLLKRPANLTANQKVKLKDLVRYNLQRVRAYLLKEDFQQLWNYESTAWAAKFLDQWCRQVMRSRIEPMKKVARTLRTHRELILNYFRAAKSSSAANSF